MPRKPPTHSPSRLFGRKCDRRPSASQRGYDEQWKRLRLAFLASHPLCSCGRPALHVDHKVALAAGGTHDEDNLQALCHSCHSRKTVACDNGFGHKVARTRTALGGGQGGLGKRG